MHYRLTGRSHNPADPAVPRFDLLIPNGSSIICELTDEQAAYLRTDPNVLVEETEIEPPPPDPELLAAQAEILRLQERLQDLEAQLTEAHAPAEAHPARKPRAEQAKE